MDRTLEAAYRRTTYWVEAPACWIPLRVGERSDALAGLLGAGRSWVFVTADNPRSEPLAPAENARRRARLDAELGPGALPGYGVGAGSDWPPEIGRLVPDLDREAARALGRRHGQLAVIFCDGQGPAELLACDA